MRASAEPRIGGATHVVGIVGWPVAHSLSPAIHNAAFVAAGLDWVYVPLPVPPGALHAALHGLVPLGFSGANVTMPHKTEAAGLIDHLSDDAKVLQAVNTIIVRGEELEGHNTDVAGFDRFLRRDAGFDPAGKSALMYGAGGAARACARSVERDSTTSRWSRAPLIGQRLSSRSPKGSASRWRSWASNGRRPSRSTWW